MDAQYQPLLDRPLELRPARRASASNGVRRSSGTASKGVGPPGYGQGSREAEAGAGPEAVQPEAWHWVPQQAIDVTRHAIAQVGNRKRAGKEGGRKPSWQGNRKVVKLQRCASVCSW